MRLSNVILAIATAALVAPAASALIDLSQLADPAQGNIVTAAAPASPAATEDDAHTPGPDSDTFTALPRSAQKAVLERHAGISSERFDQLEHHFGPGPW